MSAQLYSPVPMVPYVQPRRRSGGSGGLILLIVGAAIVFGAGGWYIYQRNRATDTTGTQQPKRQTDQTGTETAKGTATTPQTKQKITCRTANTGCQLAYGMEYLDRVPVKCEEGEYLNSMSYTNCSPKSGDTRIQKNYTCCKSTTEQTVAQIGPRVGSVGPSPAYTIPLQQKAATTCRNLETGCKLAYGMEYLDRVPIKCKKTEHLNAVSYTNCSPKTGDVRVNKKYTCCEH